MSVNETENNNKNENNSRGRRNIFSYHLPPNKDINEKRSNSIEVRKTDDSDIKQIVEIVDDPNSKPALEKVKRISDRAVKYSFNKTENKNLNNVEKNKLLVKENRKEDKSKEKIVKTNKEDVESGPIKRVGPNYAIRNQRVHLGNRINIANEAKKANDKNNRVDEVVDNNKSKITIVNKRNNHSVKTINDCKATKNRVIVNSNNKRLNSRNNNNIKITHNLNVKNYPAKNITFNNESPFKNKIVNGQHNNDNKENKDIKNYINNKYAKDNKDNKDNKDIKDNSNIKDNKEIKFKTELKNIEDNKDVKEKKDNKDFKEKKDNKVINDINDIKNNKEIKNKTEIKDIEDVKDVKEKKDNKVITDNKNNCKDIKDNNDIKNIKEIKNNVIVNKDNKKIENKELNNNNKTENVLNKDVHRLVEKKVCLDDNNKGKENNIDVSNKNIKEDNKKRYEKTIEKNEVIELNNDRKKEEEKDTKDIGDNIFKEMDGTINVNIKKNFKIFKEKKDEKNNDKKEEEKNPSKKEEYVEFKFEQIKKGEIEPETLEGKENIKLEIRKRFGECRVIFKKEKKVIKKENKNSPKKEEIKKEKISIIEDQKKEDSKKEENKRDIDEPIENPKQLNKSNDNIRFYRRNIVIHNPNDEEEKQENREEIIKEDEKPDYSSKNQNNNFTEITIEKRVIIDEGNDENQRIGQNVYKKRNYKTNTDDNKYKPRIPKSSSEEKQYVKRISNRPKDIVCSKQIIEEKNNVEDDRNLYDFQMNNIRKKIKEEKFGDDDDIKYKNRKTPFQKYNTNYKQLKYKPRNININLYNEFYDNTANFNRYRKKEFLKSYDNIDNFDDLNQKNNTLDNKYEIRYKEDKKEKQFYKRNILNDDEDRNY